MKKSSIKFQTNLRALREAAGLSQYDVANTVGIDRSRLSAIENGHVPPRAEELGGILKALRTAHQKRMQEFERIAAGVDAA